MKRPSKTFEDKTGKVQKAIDYVGQLEKYCDSLETKMTIPCDNFVYFTGKCSQCSTPVCIYCGKCVNEKCRLYLCK